MREQKTKQKQKKALKSKAFVITTKKTKNKKIYVHLLNRPKKIENTV
jgi:hypothetical protein